MQIECLVKFATLRYKLQESITFAVQVTGAHTFVVQVTGAHYILVTSTSFFGAWSCANE